MYLREISSEFVKLKDCKVHKVESVAEQNELPHFSYCCYDQGFFQHSFISLGSREEFILFYLNNIFYWTLVIKF
jgi:hypothetical protein